MAIIVCALCWAHYNDRGPCDEGKPANSPHRRTFTLDGEPVEMDDFIRTNTDPDAPGLTEKEIGEILALTPGQTLILGGGAGAEFVLRREA